MNINRIGRFILSEKFANAVDEIIEENKDDDFWHELGTRLGQRDFYCEASEEELRQVEENHGLLPEKVHEYYGKYEEEFNKYGIDRLEIKNK